MSIGETLAQARRDAGLSVADVSDRTRISPTIIESIEQDDYSATGIDLFARVEIREIARAVGVDSRPLIEEFDAARTPSAPPSSARLSEAIMPVIADFRKDSWLRRLVLALLAVAALGGGLLMLGTSGHRSPPASAARNRASRAVSHKAPSPHRSVAHAARSSVHSPSPAASTSPAAAVLAPASITAFGPGGTSQGDSPQLARLALKGNAATPWHSAWYTTPHFGNLQSGTGLLLDMGHTVTVTGVRIALRNGSGADLSLRLGNAPALADLRPVAYSHGTGNTIRMASAPTPCRYVLVWFTKLPPDSAGTFQAAVYDIKVMGHK